MIPSDNHERLERQLPVFQFETILLLDRRRDEIENRTLQLFKVSVERRVIEVKLLYVQGDVKNSRESGLVHHCFVHSIWRPAVQGAGETRHGDVLQDKLPIRALGVKSASGVHGVEIFRSIL